MKLFTLIFVVTATFFLGPVGFVGSLALIIYIAHNGGLTP